MPLRCIASAHMADHDPAQLGNPTISVSGCPAQQRLGRMLASIINGQLASTLPLAIDQQPAHVPLVIPIDTMAPRHSIVVITNRIELLASCCNGGQCYRESHRGTHRCC